MRVRMLEKVRLMLSAAENSVSFLRMSSAELIKSLADNSELKELKFLKICCESMAGGQNFRSAWLESIESGVRYLKTEDKALLISFGEFFGTSDVDGQTANFRLHSELVSERLSEARKTADRYASLSCGMGIICGVGIVVVLF